MKKEIKAEIERGNIPKELEDAFKEIQMARSPFILEHFVIGQHDTEPMQYAQCVLEMQIKYNNIRRAILNRRKLEIDAERLKKQKSEKAKIAAQLKRIDIEEQDHAMLGALREFESLYTLWLRFKKKYTREELNEGQNEYWKKRLIRQAQLDLLATGRIGVGNADALRQIGESLPQSAGFIKGVEDRFLELEGKTDLRTSEKIIQDIEQRYLKEGNVKILIAVPTEKKAENGLPNLEGILTPAAVQVKYYNVWGRKTADAYNNAVMEMLKDGADYLLTVEDDTFPQSNVIINLYEHVKNGDYDIIGAWYPKKQHPRTGVPIVIKDGKRTHLLPDGKVHEVYTIPMGCTIFKAKVFRDIPYPWFVTTDNLTQDSFFSQLAREAGYQLFIDTAIRAKHICRETGTVYE